MVVLLQNGSVELLEAPAGGHLCARCVRPVNTSQNLLFHLQYELQVFPPTLSLAFLRHLYWNFKIQWHVAYLVISSLLDFES